MSLSLGIGLGIPLQKFRGPFGHELVTNGGFAVDSDWTKAAGWTIGSGVASFNNGSAGALKQNITFSGSVTYSITFTVSNYVSGTIQPKFIGGTLVAGTIRNADGTYTETIVAHSGGNTQLSLLCVGGSNLSIDNVSVREVL